MGKRKKETWQTYVKRTGFIRSCNPNTPKKWRGSAALYLAKAPAKWKRQSQTAAHFSEDGSNDALTCDTRDMTILSWNAGNLARVGIDVKTGIKQESDIGTYLAGKVHLKIIQEATEIDKVM